MRRRVGGGQGEVGGAIFFAPSYNAAILAEWVFEPPRSLWGNRRGKRITFQLTEDLGSWVIFNASVGISL